MVVVGAGGVIEMGSRRRTSLLHHLGVENSPDHSVAPSHTPVVSGTLTSAHMPRPVGWSLSLPTGPLSGVVYCLHGHDDDHRFAFDQIHLHDVAAAAGVHIAVAAVDGGADSYWHARADGSDALTMLTDEFVPMIDARTRVSQPALLGWSMGGYGALLAAETAPTRFVVVAAASPAL
jgi:S-formylglutathione hydrolase FrmB